MGEKKNMGEKGIGEEKNMGESFVKKAWVKLCKKNMGFVKKHV